MEMKFTVILFCVAALLLSLAWYVRRRYLKSATISFTESPASGRAPVTSASSSVEARLVSPHGMELLCSAGGPAQKISIATDTFAVVEKSGPDRAYTCGHRASGVYVIDTYGRRTNPIEGHESCPECLLAELKRLSCRCGLCGHIILPGDGVALYDRDPGMRLEIATLVDDAVVGCVRMNCCPSGGFLAGHWSNTGFKPMFGGLTAAESVMNGSS